jgi:glycopeptide antibiotics resistance protein
MPFDLTLSPWQIKKKYDNGREIDAEESGAPTIDVAPYPRQIFEKTLLNIAYFMPIGAMLAQLPNRRWRMRENATRVLIVGFAIALAIEAVQLIVMSAGTYASDVVCCALFILWGWWLAIRPRALSKQSWALLAALWAVALVLCFWSPFQFEPDRIDERWTTFEWVPFADYFRGNYVGAFNRIINKIVLFVPLGFLMCRATRVAIGARVIVGAAVSAVIELGQGAFTMSSGSISDVILGAIGALAGALVANRARQQRAK